MLLMRARTWAVRDGAADALMGLQVAEEVQDYQPIRDVTPKPSGFADLAMKARGEPEDKPADAEVVLFADLPTEDAFPGSDAFTTGADAYAVGTDIESCPFDHGSQDAVDWCGGWRGAERAAS
jgi:ribosome modulation factor